MIRCRRVSRLISPASLSPSRPPASSSRRPAPLRACRALLAHPRLRVAAAGRTVCPRNDLRRHPPQRWDHMRQSRRRRPDASQPQGSEGRPRVPHHTVPGGPSVHWLSQQRRLRVFRELHEDWRESPLFSVGATRLSRARARTGRVPTVASHCATPVATVGFPVCRATIALGQDYLGYRPGAGGTIARVRTSRRQLGPSERRRDRACNGRARQRDTKRQRHPAQVHSSLRLRLRGSRRCASSVQSRASAPARRVESHSFCQRGRSPRSSSEPCGRLGSRYCWS